MIQIWNFESNMIIYGNAVIHKETQKPHPDVHAYKYTIIPLLSNIWKFLHTNLYQKFQQVQLIIWVNIDALRKLVKS